jgi:transposase
MEGPKYANAEVMRTRRHFSPEQKVVIVLESKNPGSSVSSVARKYKINPVLLYQWRRAVEQGQIVAADSEDEVVSIQEVKKLKAQIKILERSLGKKTIQVEILQEAVALAKKKKLISHMPLLPMDDGE